MSSISGKPVNLPPGAVAPDVGAPVGPDVKTTTPVARSHRAVVSDDTYDTTDLPDVQGPGTGTAAGDLEAQINAAVFKPSGLPNPYNGNTYPATEKKVAADPAFKPAVSAMKAYLASPSPQAQAAIPDALEGLPIYGNLMETLLAVIKLSVEDANEDKRYYLTKLDGFNKIADAISKDLNSLADASSTLADKERGKKHPDNETVDISMHLYDTKTVDANGDPAVTKSISEPVNRNSLGTRMKEIEGQQESVRNERQMAQTAFQAIDQRVNQLYQIMAQVSKTMNDERGTAARNML